MRLAGKDNNNELILEEKEMIHSIIGKVSDKVGRSLWEKDG